MNLLRVSALMWVVVAVRGRREGSGYYALSDDSDDLDDVDWAEGSGDLLLLPDTDADTEESEYDIHYDQTRDQDYDDDLNEYIYSDSYDDYDDMDLTLKVDDEDSVLRLETVEIKSKPTPPESEFKLETSQILIMVGSAFVSFGVAMISFFLCKRSMEKRRQKLLTVMKTSVSKPSVPVVSSPIVKNYQRVPTSTQEYLQDTTIQMDRDKGQQSDPLIQ